jgi:hypothetical protein
MPSGHHATVPGSFRAVATLDPNPGRETRPSTTPRTLAPLADTPRVFARREAKYLLGAAACEELLEILHNYTNAQGASLLEADRQGQGSALVQSLYLDTPSQLLVRRSIERPSYKEKLRVRTYGLVRDPKHRAFLEIKKKRDGLGYKRRVAMTLEEVEKFVHNGITPAPLMQEGTLNRQIVRELEWSVAHYAPLEPSLLVSCERSAFTFAGDVRITIDCDLTWREGSWDFARSATVQPLLPAHQCVLELKATGALPLELTHALAHVGAYPQSFSKVGTAYLAQCAMSN